MTTTSNQRSEPSHGEVWTVDFDPSVGSEVAKIRPAVVVSEDDVGRLPLRIVVPMTTLRGRVATQMWLVPIEATPSSGLRHESYADVFQIKSVSTQRFIERVGHLERADMETIMEGVAVCLGW